MTSERFEQLKVIAQEMRIDILNMCHNCGQNNAHLGGCLSSVEILAVLFLEIIKVNGVIPNKADEVCVAQGASSTGACEARDRFVLSKGHAGIALYAALKQVGVLSQHDIEQRLRGPDAVLFRHPTRNPNKFIEISSGSLGQGLSYGAGLALAMKKKPRIGGRTFVLIGDGECNEGAIWEAATFANHYKLDNLTVIIDKNGLQLDGFTDMVMSIDNHEARWSSVGFDAVTVNGHDIHALYDALSQSSNRISQKPLAIIANTVKGKGVSFAENAPEWHDGFLNDELFATALREVANGSA